MSRFAAKAMIPNPRLAACKPFIGAWRTAGRHALLPGVELHGRTTFDWHEGGAFLIMRSEIDEPSVPTGIAIIGSDDQLGAFTMLYFDERGVSRHYEVSIDHGVMRWSRAAPDFSQRYSITASSDGRTLHSAGELSRDGVTWNADLELHYDRLK